MNQSNHLVADTARAEQVDRYTATSTGVFETETNRHFQLGILKLFSFTQFWKLDKD